MHIKHIHNMIEKLSKCADAEVEKGIEQLDTKEMGEVAEILKELTEAEYYATITKAMGESEYGEDYDEYGPMEEGRRGYRGQPRSESGRFISRNDGRRNNRGRGGRRGYEEPMHYTMTPEMYHMYPPEYWRDMDREDMGRMYYSGSSQGQSSGMSGGQSGSIQGGNTRSYQGGRQSEGGNYSSRMQDGGRDEREGRSGQSRRSYMESKEMGSDKQSKMKELENYTKELAEDVTEMISGASPEEKNLLKTKMQTLIQKIS